MNPELLEKILDCNQKLERWG